jgi:hypothetical protein
MDDLKVSSWTFEQHVRDCGALCSAARKGGLEFRLSKGQFNQPSIKFWGCILDGRGRTVEPKKVDQLEAWPELDSAAA